MKSLEEFRAAGAFLDRAPVQKVIKFALGGEEHEATIHVLRLSLAQQERMYAKLADKSGGDDPKMRAVMIATLVRLGENGDEQISIDEARDLDATISNAMIEAIGEVNGSAAKN